MSEGERSQFHRTLGAHPPGLMEPPTSPFWLSEFHLCWWDQPHLILLFVLKKASRCHCSGSKEETMGLKWSLSNSGFSLEREMGQEEGASEGLHFIDEWKEQTRENFKTKFEKKGNIWVGHILMVFYFVYYTFKYCLFSNFLNYCF